MQIQDSPNSNLSFKGKTLLNTKRIISYVKANKSAPPALVETVTFLDNGNLKKIRQNKLPQDTLKFILDENGKSTITYNGKTPTSGSLPQPLGEWIDKTEKHTAKKFLKTEVAPDFNTKKGSSTLWGNISDWWNYRKTKNELKQIKKQLQTLPLRNNI